MPRSKTGCKTAQIPRKEGKMYTGATFSNLEDGTMIKCDLPSLTQRGDSECVLKLHNTEKKKTENIEIYFLY
jgi:hypothetical protein